MPFDGTGFQTKPDVYTLESLIAWLEKQPRDGVYWFSDPQGCLWAQYLRDSGVERCVISPKEMPDAHLGSCGWGIGVAIGRPQTFGGALKRAYSHQSKAERFRRFLRRMSGR